MSVGRSILKTNFVFKKNYLSPEQYPSGLCVIFPGHDTSYWMLSRSFQKQATCDFYSPIHNIFRDEFLDGLKSTPHAHYCGMTKGEVDFQLISQYDVFILSAYDDADQYPEVLIEVMQAGEPVITSKGHTFPELITNGINGFMDSPQDSYFHVMANSYACDRSEYERKDGDVNHWKCREFRADKFAVNCQGSFPRI